MTKRYTGGVVSSAVPTVNAAGASGVFLLSQQADAAAKNNWPPFKVEKSLRFRSAASAYLSRTPSVTSNRRTWTYSAWVKRGVLSAAECLFTANDGSGGSNLDSFEFNTNDVIRFYLNGATSAFLVTSQVFRDPAAWYHLVLAVDTTQATSSNRLKLYVNGTQVTSFSTANYPSQNYDTFFNLGGRQTIINAAAQTGLGAYFDGYMSEVNFIDGQALTPSSFGGTDKDGNWSPIAYTGSYGQNGYYLNFKDATSTTTLGYDYSGNGNNWTTSGLSVTAGSTYDSMIDVPSDQSGANTRGNYCTLNPLNSSDVLGSSTYIKITNGNLNVELITNASTDLVVPATMSVTTGTYYYEFKLSSTGSGSNYHSVGAYNGTQFSGQAQYLNSTIYYWEQGKVRVNGTFVSTGLATCVAGDVIGVALNATTGAISFYKNNTLLYTASSLAYTIYTPLITGEGGSGRYFNGAINFGQQPFSYTPPAGYLPLNTYNLPEPTIKQPNKHFDATLYTGNDSGQSVTNAGSFQPSLIWYKARSSAYYNTLIDDIRGAGTRLFSNLTDGESNDGIMTSFNTNGFTLGTNSGEGINKNAVTYVAWQWKGATSNTTNTTGGLTSVIRVNQTSGFSVVTYTGNLTAAGTASVGHGLSVAPSMIIFKARNATTAWPVQHISLAANNTLNMSGTNGSLNQTSNGNLPKPTASVFYTNWTTGMNINGNTQVAYCFAPIAGFSDFGSYVGNGSTDGPFVFTGFRPKFIMIKAISGTLDWEINDSSRNPSNVANLALYPDLSNAETSIYAYKDILSNGFKIRTSDGNSNTSGTTYVYAAFAEMPFKYARSR
jgi:hypothetical protein